MKISQGRVQADSYPEYSTRQTLPSTDYIPTSHRTPSPAWSNKLTSLPHPDYTQPYHIHHSAP